MTPSPVPDAGPAAAPTHALLDAAAPLLRALAAIQCAQEPPAAGLQPLHDRLAQEVLEFSRACDRAGLRQEQMLAARYALCTALDEALSCKPWAGGEQGSVGPWSQYALLQEFHQEGEGGRTVFPLIARLAAQPREHRDVLEVMLHILALGFMGDYRCRADGAQALEQVRRRLLCMLGGDTQPLTVAPHAMVARVPRPGRPWGGVLACWVALLGLSVPVACAGVWRSQVQQESTALREQLLGLRAQAESALARAAPQIEAQVGPARPSFDGAVDPGAGSDAALRDGQLELGDNATAEGSARNRRVEILLHAGSGVAP